MNHFTCTETKVGPVIDLIWAALNVTGAAIAISDEAVEDRDQVIAVGLGWGLVSGAAAFVGLDKTAKCRKAKRLLVQRQMRMTPISQATENVAGVNVTPSQAALSPGDEIQLLASAHGSSGATIPNKVFIWSSSNDAIASVSPAGLVTAHAEGTVAIAARTDSGPGSVVGITRISVLGSDGPR
jgi:hypothetical protein